MCKYQAKRGGKLQSLKKIHKNEKNSTEQEGQVESTYEMVDLIPNSNKNIKCK